MLCQKCLGSKKYMGSGMIFADCDLCDDNLCDDTVAIDTKSKAYQDAIKKIMKLDKKCTRETAVEIFEKEFNKLDKTVQNASDL